MSNQDIRELAKKIYDNTHIILSEKEQKENPKLEDQLKFIHLKKIELTKSELLNKGFDITNLGV